MEHPDPVLAGIKEAFAAPKIKFGIYAKWPNSEREVALETISAPTLDMAESMLLRTDTMFRSKLKDAGFAREDVFSAEFHLRAM